MYFLIGISINTLLHLPTKINPTSQQYHGLAILPGRRRRRCQQQGLWWMLTVPPLTTRLPTTVASVSGLPFSPSPSPSSAAPTSVDVDGGGSNDNKCLPSGSSATTPLSAACPTTGARATLLHLRCGKSARRG
jgi:hypothetical protein